MGAAWVAMLSVAQFHGVGPVTAKRMQALGIETGADLRAKSLAFLQAHFGKAAEWYYAIARGRDDRPVNPDRTRKSSGSETTFDRDLIEIAEIEAGVLRMADDVWDWCDGAQSFGRTVTIKVKFTNFQQITRSRSYLGPIAQQAALRQASLDLIRSIFPLQNGIRLVGVTVSNFDGTMRETNAHEDSGLPLFGWLERSGHDAARVMAASS
jgi:DNA polymerase-4